MEDEAFHHAMQLALQKEIEEVISKATRQPITEDEKNLLCWASGVSA